MTEADILFPQLVIWGTLPTHSGRKLSAASDISAMHTTGTSFAKSHVFIMNLGIVNFLPKVLILEQCK